MVKGKTTESVTSSAGTEPDCDVLGNNGRLAAVGQRYCGNGTNELEMLTSTLEE